ncbi:MAG: hypothetical protein ABFD92_16020 [Planctomycetaceae bacterium]|nr:hypothetical protein [Planctomycetaceae bacterium]
MADENKDGKKTRRELLLGAAGAVAAGAAGYSVYRYVANKDQPPAEHRYDLSPYQGTQGAPILYREEVTRGIATKLKEPRGIAIGGSGGVYVVGDQIIRLPYSLYGDQPYEINCPPGAPMCAAESEKTLFLGFKDRIAVLTDLSKWQKPWPSRGDKARFAAIAVSGDNVFVADAGNRVVLRYDRAGKLINEIGRKDAAKGCEGLVVPSPYMPLAVTSDGLLRVSNPGKHRVEAYTFDGRFELSWGMHGTAIDKFCGCCNPIALAMISGGRFVTVEKGITRIKVYDAEGKFQGVVAGPDQFAEHDTICAAGTGGCTYGGLSVAAAPDDTLYVLDPCTRQVRVFVPKPAEAKHG